MCVRFRPLIVISRRAAFALSDDNSQLLYNPPRERTRIGMPLDCDPIFQGSKLLRDYF